MAQPGEPTLSLDLGLVLNQLADGVLVVDRDLHILFANDAAAALSRYRVSELLERSLADLVARRERGRLEELGPFFQLEGVPLAGRGPVRTVAVRRDGSEFEVDVTLGVAPLGPEQGPLLIVSIRDVTDAVAIEKEATAAAYLRAMLGVMAELEGATGEQNAVGRVLPALCENLDWEGAALWLASEGRLTCIDSWVSPDSAGDPGGEAAAAVEGGSLQLPFGEGLAGTCALERRTISYTRAEIPPDWPAGLFTGLDPLELLAFPLLGSEGEVLGVVELESLHPGKTGEELRDVLDAIGHQLGQFLAAIRADERRRAAEREREELLTRIQAAERSQAFLLRASQILGEAASFAESLDALAALAVPALGDICLIDIAHDEGGLVRMAARHADPRHQVEVQQLGARYTPRPGGSHPAVSVIRSGRSIWSDTMSDDFLRSTTRDEEHYRLVKALGFSSYLSVPLKSRRRVLGALTIVSTRPDRRIGSQDLLLAESLAKQAAEVVEKQRRYEREHEMAHILQSSLLPAELEQPPGYELAVRYLPSTLGAEVGGDWYDVLRLANRRWAVTVGDVSGHDVQAAAAMGRLRTAARALAARSRGPVQLLNRLRDAWDHLDVERTATVVVAALDPGENAVVVSIAGHPSPLLIADGVASHVAIRPDTPLGAPPVHAEERRVPLPPGSTLLLYSDGLVEMKRRPLSEGLELLRTSVEGMDGSLEALCDTVLSSIASERSDDLALLAIRRLPEPA